MTGLSQDFGVFDDPDTFYSQIGTNLAGAKAVLYRWIVRHLMNRAVARVRSCRPAVGTRATA